MPLVVGMKLCHFALLSFTVLFNVVQTILGLVSCLADVKKGLKAGTSSMWMFSKVLNLDCN